MKYLALVGSLAALLSTGSASARGLLLRRDEGSSSYPGANDGADNTHAIFQKSTETYSKTVEIVQESCNRGDTESVYASITTLETSMKTVEETTQQFDSNTATTYKESVVQIIASYSSIVTVLSTYPDVENGCHESLKQTTSYTQSVVDVYLKLGICLEEDVNNAGGLNTQAFSQLNLELNLKEKSSSESTTNTSSSNETTVPARENEDGQDDGQKNKHEAEGETP